MTVNATAIVQHIIQIKDGIMIHVSASVKSTGREKKFIVGILIHVFLRTISDTLVIVGDEIINVRDSLSINVTQTLPTNVKSTISVNPNDKKTTCEKSNFLVRTKHVRKVISLFALFY